VLDNVFYTTRRISTATVPKSSLSENSASQLSKNCLVEQKWKLAVILVVLVVIVVFYIFSGG